MSDDDRLRSALRDLRASALPLIAPPGVEHVRHTLRRRRATRSAAAALTVVSLAVGVVMLPRTPVTPPAPLLTQPFSVTPSVAPTTASASPSPTGRSSRSAPGRAPAATTQSCLRGNHISVVDDSAPSMVAEVDAIPLLCPDETLYFFWATYRPTGPDSLELIGSGRLSLDAKNLRRTFTIGTNDSCHAWFVVEGRGQIRATVGRPDAYGYDNSAQPYGPNTRVQHLPEQPACYPEPTVDPSPSG